MAGSLLSGGRLAPSASSLVLDPPSAEESKRSDTRPLLLSPQPTGTLRSQVSIPPCVYGPDTTIRPSSSFFCRCWPPLLPPWPQPPISRRYRAPRVKLPLYTHTHTHTLPFLDTVLHRLRRACASLCDVLNTMLTSALSRWVAAKSYRHEYARLAQRRQSTLER